MGDFNAGLSALGLLVYFVLFSIIITSVNNGLATYGNDLIQSTNEGTDWGLSTSGYECTSPRTYTTTSGELKEGKARSLACIRTEGMINPDVCDGLNGCTWRNSTSYFFGAIETNAICSGQINETYYNDNESLGLFQSICKLSDAQNNRSLCENIGCTFISITSGDISHSTIVNMIGSLFTFDVSYGFETQAVNNIITIIFIYIPLFFLIICIYFMIPIIH